MLVQTTSSRSSSHVGVAAGATTKELHKGRDSRSRTVLIWRGLENFEGAVKSHQILSSNVQMLLRVARVTLDTFAKLVIFRQYCQIFKMKN